MLTINSDPAEVSTELEATPQNSKERDRMLPLILLGMATLALFVASGCALWLSNLIVDMVFMSTTLHSPSALLGH